MADLNQYILLIWIIFLTFAPGQIIRHCCQQFLSVFVPGIMQHAFAVTHFNQLALLHYANFIGDLCHHAKVVCDKQNTHALALLQFFN